MMEHAFDAIGAPIGRLHTDPVAHPFSPTLEAAVTVSTERIVAAAQSVLAGHAPGVRRLRARSPGETATSKPSAFRPALTQPSMGSSAAATTNEGAVNHDAIAAPQGTVPLIMPHGDLTITEGTVVGWLKQVGDSVMQGEGVVDVETDKAVLTVESPVEGHLAEILAREGQVVLLGQTLGLVRPVASNTN
jgi:2-oxoisovalerate dehydrogenase E1 component